MTEAMPAQLDSSARFKSCFRFTVAADTLQRAKRFRDPIALGVLREAAKQLASEGLRVTEVRPGKACDGGFRIRFEKCDIEVVIGAERRTGVVDCAVLTWYMKPAWRRVSSEALCEAWDRACTLVGKVLAQNARVRSLRRVTEDETE
jgi:hypothetical protein